MCRNALAVSMVGKAVALWPLGTPSRASSGCAAAVAAALDADGTFAQSIPSFCRS